ncbi:MAG: hypothetical protein IKN43_04155 [Selenomonadaceae bacterium]|nr:hypothetical protein [Selenomonadaceae bacterium]
MNYDLMSDNADIYAKLDMSEWNVCEKISFFAKKEIDDNLSLDEQKEEIEDFHKKITKKFENLKDSSWNQDYDYVFESKPIEKVKLPNWAIMKLHDYQEAVSIQMVKSAKDGNFKWVLDAISGGKEVSYGPFSSEDSLELMKAAIKNHGADNQFLKSMAKAIARCNSEDQEFTQKLLKETLKTEEYKKAAKEILQNNKKSGKNVGR